MSGLTSYTNPLPPPKSLLIIPPRFIGDLILHIPLTRQLKILFPDCKLSMCVPQSAFQLLNDCPYLDTLLIEKNKSAELRQLLKQNTYDTALITRPSIGAALACKWAGVPHRIGFSWQRIAKNRYLRSAIGLSHGLSYPALETDEHHITHLNRFLACWGKESAAPADMLELWPNQNIDTSLPKRLPIDQMRPLAVVHLSAASEHKALPLERWALTLQWLEKQGYQVILTGMDVDKSSYECLIRSFQLQAINAAGLLQLEELPSLLKLATLLLSLDSAPIHIAAAVETPYIVGFYGATNPAQWGAYTPYSRQTRFHALSMDLPCKPCMSKVCSTNQCREGWDSLSLLNQIKQALHPVLQV